MKRNTFSSWQNHFERKKYSKYRNRRCTPYTHNQRKKWSSLWFYKFLMRIVGIIMIIVILWILLIWWAYLRDVKDVWLIESWWYFAESTVYYDGQWGEMYRESDRWTRQYIAYWEISKSIKDAIISAEDQRFFENPWFDIVGLFRAGINYVTGKSDNVKGTSTLSQQLIKNTLLTNERSIKRKVQEAYLAYELNKRYSKEKILEMYLNAIEFWHNAIGVEQASKSFFWKSAKDVWPLGATILASLPKSPTRFSPYLHRDRLMWKIEAYPSNQTEDRTTLNLETANGKFASLYVPFREYIKNIKFSQEWNQVKICNVRAQYTDSTQFPVDSNWCVSLSFNKLLDFMGSTKVTWDFKQEDGTLAKYTIEYTIWRKDFVAYRMFEDGKISPETFWEIWSNGLEFQFQKIRHTIKYPYFVMMVKEYLEHKYGDDLNIKRGLKVYTTIDPDLQNEAEKIVYDHVQKSNKARWANSAALVSMDNKTGKLLALVGWPDYFDEKNGGNNNMATAYRQPGSSFKPLVYALAISKFPIGNNTPVADVSTSFGRYKPNNYDDAFEWILPLRKAIWHSRNIPAIKMYYLAWQEEKIKNFVSSLGITGLKENYGAPMALGVSETRPIDLMQAYSVLANNGVKRNLFFVQKIEDTQGGLIYEHTKKEEEIFSPSAAYITSLMLSDPSARPEIAEWKRNLDIGRPAAGKTGTANKPAKPGSRIIYPWDLWTAGYTPQITTVVWAGNVDGSATKRNCFGLNCAAPIWNKFMRFAHKNQEKENFQKPKWIFEYTISRLSGKLATKNTADGDKVQTYTAVKLTEYDDGFKEIQVDRLCGWPVTDKTPRDDIVTRKVPASSLIDSFDPNWIKGFVKQLWSGITGSGTSSKPCVRPNNIGPVTISTRMVGISNNIIQINWNGERKIRQIILSENGNTIKTVDYTNPKAIANDRINMSRVWDVNNLKITLIDIYWYRYEKTGVSTTWGNDNLINNNNNNNKTPNNDPNALPPKVQISNPKGNSIGIYKWDMFNLRFNAWIQTDTREVVVKVDGTPIHSATQWNIFVIPISTQDMSVGTHTITITATDANLKSDTKNFTLNIMNR